MGKRGTSQSLPFKRGQGLVELSLVVPLLMVAMLGMVEAAWFMHSVLIVDMAAREGARFAARGPHLAGDVLLAANAIADQASISLAQSLEIDMAGADANATILVTLITVRPDGTWSILPSDVPGGGSPPTYKLGELDGASTVCTSGPCPSKGLDLEAIATGNEAFSGDSVLCEGVGEVCVDDLAVVEIVYLHEPLIFKLSFLPQSYRIRSRAVMRVFTD